VKPSVGKKEGIFGKKEILGERRSNAAEAPGESGPPGVLTPGPRRARQRAVRHTHITAITGITITLKNRARTGRETNRKNE